MKEVLDGDEAREGSDEVDIFTELADNKHLPSFDFNAYPELPDEDDGTMNSPRIRDEILGNYEIQSQDETGASQLR